MPKLEWEHRKKDGYHLAHSQNGILYSYEIEGQKDCQTLTAYADQDNPLFIWSFKRVKNCKIVADLIENG